VFILKTFVKLFLVFLVALNFAGCKPKTDGRIELEFWTLQLNDFTPYIEQKIDIYEKNHPNIKIKWIDIPFSEGEKRTLSAVMSDNVPDVVNLNPSFASTLESKKVLTTIDRDFDDIYVPSALNLCRQGSGYYAIPWYVTSSVTIYNKEILEQAGFKTPLDSYQGFFTFSQKIKQATGKYALMPNLAEDGKMLKTLAKEGVDLDTFFDSEKTIQNYELFKALYRQNLIPKGSINQTHRDSLEKYMAGDTAVLEAGANFLKTIEQNAPEVYKKTDVSPQMNLQNGIIDISLMNLVIPIKSKHPQEAIDFALFMTNDANQLEFCKLAPVLPSTKKALEDEFFAQENTLIDKGRKISANQLKNAQNSSRIYPNQKQINEVIDYATQIILLDKKSIKQALVNAKSSLASISR
jgi:putative chitobiose transport system substrate-binding protein